MRSQIRPIIAWLLLACFFLPSFVGQGLHALPGCGHVHHSAEGRQSFVAELPCDQGGCSHSHKSHGSHSHSSQAKLPQASSDVTEATVAWQAGQGEGDHDHNCLICAFLAISKLASAAKAAALEGDSVFGKHLVVTLSYVQLCFSCSPRGPPAFSCEINV